MPLIWLTTNVKLESDEAFQAFVREFMQLAAKTIGKDPSAFFVNCQYNPSLIAKGSFEPAVMVQTMSLDNTNPENSIVWTKAFSDFFQEKLGIPHERAIMGFMDLGPDFIGMKGTTAAVLRASAPK